jgi:hypothetical protein
LLRKDFISNDQEEENTNYFVLIFALLLALVPQHNYFSYLEAHHLDWR